MAIRLCRSAGVAALDALDEALLPLAGVLVSSAVVLLVASAPPAVALDVEAGLVDAVAGVLEVSAVAAVVVALALGVVDPVLVVDAVPLVPAATTSDLGSLSAWVLTIGRWPGR